MVYEVDDLGNVIPDESPMDLLDVSPTTSNSCTSVLKNKDILSNCSPFSGIGESIAQTSPSCSKVRPVVGSKSKETQTNPNPKPTFEATVSQMSRVSILDFSVDIYLFTSNFHT